jgi:hypothetical protein
MKKIPLEFNHAFSNNQCPACGGKILDEDVIGSFLELKEVALAYPKSEDFLSVIISSFKFEKTGPFYVSEPESVEVEEKQLSPVPTQAIVKTTPKPIIRTNKSIVEGQKLNSNNDIFMKRAGADRLKNIVQDIKSKTQEAADMEDFEGEDLDATPLSRNEGGVLENMFEPNKAEQILELEKIKRLQNRGGGKINRSE